MYGRKGSVVEQHINELVTLAITSRMDIGSPVDNRAIYLSLFSRLQLQLNVK